MTAEIDDASTYPYSHCPFCGSAEFFIKERLSGSAEFHFMGDGSEVDNCDMYEGIQDSMVGKHCYCAKCQKALFEVEYE